MSGVVQRETVIALGAVNDNLVSGSAFEYARVPQLVTLGVNLSATGAFVTVQAGPTIVLEESPPIVATTFPVIPDQMAYQFVMAPGDRMVVRCRNPTGGALTARLLAQIQDF